MDFRIFALKKLKLFDVGWRLVVPISARGLPGHGGSGNGQCGHLPVEIFRAKGKAGIEFSAGGRAKAGTGMPVTHHYNRDLTIIGAKRARPDVRVSVAS